MSIVSAVSCMMIDAIVTGQFLGVEAVTAAGLVHPVIMTGYLVGDVSYLRAMEMNNLIKKPDKRTVPLSEKNVV